MDDGLDPSESKKHLGEDESQNEEDQNLLNAPDESIKTTPFSKNNHELDIFSNHMLVQKASNKLSVKQSPSNIDD